MFRVARGSANWIITPISLAIVCVSAASWFDAPWLVPLSAVFLFAFMAMWWFFRDPQRATGNFVVSPADGKVVALDDVDDADVGPAQRLSIFMGPMDVHVNRMPLAGDVRWVRHTPGGHVPAFRKESDRNERVTTLARTQLGDVKLVQIAGAVARRIVPYIEAGQHVPAGARIGLIRLGSRCDLLLPRGTAQWTVKVGQRVKAGLSTVARPPASGDAP